MPLKASIGLSRKVGLEHYSSLGASCHLEVDLDGSLIQDPATFHEKLRRIYALAHQAVVDELERRTPGPGNGNGSPPNGDGQEPPPPRTGRTRSPRSGGSREDAPASERQIKFLLDLARQRYQMDPDQAADYCEQLVGVGDLDQLTKAQASAVIDQLGNGQNTGSRR